MACWVRCWFCHGEFDRRDVLTHEASCPRCQVPLACDDDAGRVGPLLEEASPSRTAPVGDSDLAQQLSEELDTLSSCSRRLATLIEELPEASSEREAEAVVRGAVTPLLEVLRRFSG